MCPKRCGGQGDILTGFLAVFLFWCNNKSFEMNKINKTNKTNKMLVSSILSTNLLKYLAYYTYQHNGISMTASDMITNIPNVLMGLLNLNKESIKK